MVRAEEFRQPMHLRTLAAVALAAAVWSAIGAARPAAAETAQRWTPEAVAELVEKSANSTSFAQLEAFGREAMQRPGRDGLDRLYHVSWLFLNQSEFQRFDLWNARLKARAAQQNDTRYLEIAALDELRSRFDRGDMAAGDEIKRRAGLESDWFARAHAKSTAAYVMVVQDEVGAALKLLYEADDETPHDLPGSGQARAGIWESIGLALMNLHDLSGAAAAFGRQQFEFSPAGYPRPDFDGLYNMASLASELGRRDLADRLAAAHHRLAARSDLQGLGVWDANLCAKVAEAEGDSRTVLTCLEPLGDSLGTAQFLAPRLLPARAIARARLGQAAGAARDLARLQALHATKAFGEAKFERLPEVEAQVLRAQGHAADAFDRLDRYARQHGADQSQAFSVGIHQITQEMDKQLGARRDQLATAQRNANLQQQVIKSQHMIVVMGGFLACVFLGLLFWQAHIAQALRRARHNAEAANRAKSEFLANMSHEIRTPLNGVVAVADMLARADMRPREQEMVEIIRSSGDTLQRLLSDVLDLARIESGRITIEAAPFHAGDLVRAVAALSQLRCDEKGVALKVEVAADLDGVVSGDMVRVRQVLTNFLSNAVKFTETGAIEVRAERMDSGLARFIVSDTGVGFDPANKTRVMGRFQQADSSITRRFGGTGLGLAICAELAGLMGGAVDCDSTPGAGSRFWLDVPLPPAEAAPNGPSAASAGGDAEPGRPRVLVADDHPTNRRVVELMLSDVADLYAAENGQEALDALVAGPAFDLVLMDMQMPVMDGLTAVREIRRREAANGLARVPIVMLTANAMPEHIADALAAGADLHLGKPFTAQALFGAMDEAMAAGETAKELAA
jgi:signal transduction histidine kinase/ActR/RegA family two-component response regulator